MEVRPTERGGRRTPVSPGYRPTALLDGEYHDVMIWFEGAPVRPGEREQVRVVPLRIDFWRAIDIGERIDLTEGKRLIGELTVTSIEGMP